MYQPIELLQDTKDRLIFEGWTELIESLPEDWFKLSPDIQAEFEVMLATEHASQQKKFCLCQYPCVNWGKGPCSDIKGIEYI